MTVGKLTLDTPVQYVKRVGPTRAEQLADLGIHTVEDLLTYYPRKFNLRAQVQPIATLRDDQETVTFAGEVIATDYRGYGRRPFFECELQDETASVMIKWFHGGYLRDKIKPGLHIAVSGKPSTYKGLLQFINPPFQIIYDPEGTDLDQDELLPVYPAGAKLSSGHIALVVKQVLPEAKELIARWFADDYLNRRGLMNRPDAVAAMHRPEDTEHWSAARRRIAYDECLLMQLGIALVRMREMSRPAHTLESSDEIDRRIRARFPFDLTDARGHELAMEPKKLADEFDLVDETDFRVLCQHRHEQLGEMIESDPAAVLIGLCTSNGGRIDAMALKEQLVPQHVAADKWSGWWTRARTAVRRTEQLTLEGKNPVTVVYHPHGLTIEQELAGEVAKAYTPLDRLDLLRRYVREVKHRKGAVDAAFTAPLLSKLAEQADDFTYRSMDRKA